MESALARALAVKRALSRRRAPARAVAFGARASPPAALSAPFGTAAMEAAPKTFKVFISTSHRTSLVVTCPPSFNVAQLLGAHWRRGARFPGAAASRLPVA